MPARSACENLNIYNETKSNLPSSGWKDIDSSFTFTRNGNIWKNNYNGRRGAQSEDQIEKTSNRVGVYFKTRRRDKNLYVGLREGENSGNLPFEISYAFKLKSNRQLYIYENGKDVKYVGTYNSNDNFKILVKARE